MKATLLFVFQVVTATVLWGQSFVHPGAMNTKKDLDFIKAKIKANAEPWKSAYSSFLTSKAGSYDGINPQPYSSLNYVHRPFASVDCGSYNNPNVGCNDIVYDGMAAYSLALQFFITDDVRYATKAIKIITDWSNTYQKNTESNSRLVVSWATPWFVNAGEILRYTAGSGWTNTETSKLNTLLDKFKTYIFWEDKPANNWMMSSVEARLAIAVFQNDRPAFDAAIVKWKERIKTYIYQTTDGSQPIIPAGGTRSWSDGQWKDNRTAVPNYVNGLCMETCRDISHTKLGVTSLANGAEIAWSQGVDLFSTEKKRFSDFLELHAPWMMGANPPNNICDGYLDIVSEEAFEILYNHLHDRLGVNLPQSKTMLLRNRPNSANRWVTKWETLCYADRSFATPVPNKAPVASFSAPTFTSIDEGYADLYVKVDASDPDGDSISLVLKIDGVEIRTETNPPYEWGHVSTNPTTDVETQGLAAGDHVFEVIVTDNKGALTTIKKTITVNRVNQAPTVSITSPTNGTIFKVGDAITIKANASDDLAIQKVNFKINGSYHSQDLTATGLEYSTVFTPTADGKYTIGARAFDDEGLATEVTIEIEVLTVTSVENSIEQTVSIYPNPTNGYLQLSKSTVWEVYNSQGVKVNEGTGTQVDISANPKGIYILKTGNTTTSIYHQ